MEINQIEEILERDVVGIGTGAHINIPKKHLGKKARISILRADHPCEECKKPIYNQYQDFCEECCVNYNEIVSRKGKEILIRILKKGLKNTRENEKNKEFYKRYLELIKKSKIYDHFYEFVYNTDRIERKKGRELDEENILEIVRIGKLDKIKQEGVK